LTVTLRGRRRRGPALELALTVLLALLTCLPAGGTENPVSPLTSETLGTFLRALGYEPELIPSASGGIWGYGIPVKQSGRTFNVEVQVSSDEQTVWVIVPLRIVPDPPKLPAPRLLRLLEENDQIGPASFAYVNRRFHLNLPLPNHGLTPARFRNDLQALLGTIGRTEPLWNPAKWASEEASPSRARQGIR